jgi:hypothetical protein
MRKFQPKITGGVFEVTGRYINNGRANREFKNRNEAWNFFDKYIFKGSLWYTHPDTGRKLVIRKWNDI